MCTVSLVQQGGAIRVVCNRDERRARPAAFPPRLHHAGPRVAMWPVDPVGGGTWIGVNDDGLFACLLNRHPDPGIGRSSRGTSRGAIVPRVLAHGRLDDALESGTRAHRETFEPFTLVLLQGVRVAVIRNVDDAPSRLWHGRLDRPMVFTSSALGDHLVAAPRRTLFRDLVMRSGNAFEGQSAFHRHQWRDRPEMSVCMRRADAATVSRTVVDLTRRSCSMRYTVVS